MFQENLPSHALRFKSVFTNHCSVSESLKSSSFISYVNIKSTALGGACYTSRGLAREGTTPIIIKGRGGKEEEEEEEKGEEVVEKEGIMIDDDDGKILILVI